jgi:hypothetical protein
MPGRNYQESIVNALQASKAIVFLFSESSNTTGEVKKELSLASSFDKPVLPVRLSPITPNAALLYELATRQWIDAFPKMEDALDKVVAAVRENTGAALDAPVPSLSPAPAPTPPPQRAAGAPPPAPILADGTPEFEAIRVLLARHVGPIAKLLVQKAAKGARSADDLLDQLGAHVADSAPRAEFLKAARARLG